MKQAIEKLKGCEGCKRRREKLRKAAEQAKARIKQFYEGSTKHAKE